MKKIEACIVFAEKPKTFLLNGFTKSGAGDGIAVDDKIFDFIPLHEANFMDELKAGDKEERSAFSKRSQFKGRAQLVNFTMVKNVVLLSMEAAYETGFGESKMIAQWRSLYGSAPSAVEYTLEMAKGNEKSHSIKKEMFDRFKGNEAHWAQFVEPLVSVLNQLSQALKAKLESPGSSQAGSATSASTPKASGKK